VGFANPDGSMVLVITNQGKARTIQVQMSSSTAEVSLPDDSVSTLTWNG